MKTLTQRQRSFAQRGFTLIEAMVVISIMAILAGTSVSSFVWLNQSTQIRGATFDLIADLDFARSEAVKRNADVVVAPATVTGSMAGRLPSAQMCCGLAIRLEQRLASPPLLPL